MKKMTKNLLAIGLIIMMITASLPLAIAQSIHVSRTKYNEASSSRCLFDVSTQENFAISANQKTAVVLSPAEWKRPGDPSHEIVKYLKNIDYDVIYKENEEVTLNFIKNNLNVDVVFNIGHGDFVDHDNNGEKTFFIASGERWTENTEIDYADEIANGTIAKVPVGYDVIGYNADLISNCYRKESFPDKSLVYMATCGSFTDDSMASAFRDVGVSAYIGWDGDPFFWINNRASKKVFRLLCCRGETVGETCRKVGYGGLLNRLPLATGGTKLKYIGEDGLRITDPNDNNKKTTMQFLPSKTSVTLINLIFSFYFDIEKSAYV
jgi:hypothetical protein